MARTPNQKLLFAVLLALFMILAAEQSKHHESGTLDGEQHRNKADHKLSSSKGKGLTYTIRGSV